MTLQDILDMLQQSGGTSPTTSGGGAASVSKSALAGLPGIGSLAAGPTSLANAASAGNPSGIVSGVGQTLMEIPTPYTEIPGALLELLGNLGVFGGAGVPREAKSASIGQALSASGNPLSDLLGNFVTQGVNAGHVFSEGGNRTFGQAVERIAGMLAALTGQSIPTVTGTGNFQNNPTLQFPALGSRGDQRYQLPAGYEFAQDPSKYGQLFKDVSGVVGNEATMSGKEANSEWQRVLQELIGQGILQKYQGPLGPVHGGSAVTGGAGGAPNIALPHPLNPNPSKFPAAPYQPLAA